MIMYALEDFLDFEISQDDKDILDKIIYSIPKEFVLDLCSLKNRELGRLFISKKIIESNKYLFLKEELEILFFTLELFFFNELNPPKDIIEKYHVRKLLFCEILDIFESIILLSQKRNFISAYGLVRSFKERVLYLRIINEDPNHRSILYLKYYNNYLKNSFDWDVEVGKEGYWFEEIEGFKKIGFKKIMERYNIGKFSFFSKYIHSNFGNHFESKYFTDTGPKIEGVSKEDLFLESYYLIFGEICDDLIGLIGSFENKDKIIYKNLLFLIHCLIEIKKAKYNIQCQ